MLHLSGTSLQTGPQKKPAKASVSTNSEAATLNFIRRTLCAHQLHAKQEKGRSTPKPLDELLPPLTSSNEVDLQLYAIIAIVVKDLLQSWYSRITPDHVFVDEVIRILAHCTRALEQRLRKIDVEALLLDEIPGLVDAHIEAYRTANQASNDAQDTATRDIYHTLRPHPALSPVPDNSDPSSVLEQNQNETSYRQLLVQGLLAVLLPTEDCANSCLRALVCEILAEVILGKGIGGKACDPWLIWEATTKILEVVQQRMGLGALTEEKPQDPKSRLERYGLVSSDGPTEMVPTSHGGGLPVAELFWRLIEYIIMAVMAMRAVILTVATSSSLPPRQNPATDVSRPRTPISATQEQPSSQATSSGTKRIDKKPIIDMAVCGLFSNLTELPVRMPWLAGLLSLLHWTALTGPGKIGDTDGILDKFLSSYIRTHILNPYLLPSLLLLTRTSLFAGNTISPARTPPTAAETLAIKRKCAETILTSFPVAIRKIVFATEDKEEQRMEVEERWLDLFGDVYMNKHLIHSIVECLVLGLVPEMGEVGVGELMRERLGGE